MKVDFVSHTNRSISHALHANSGVSKIQNTQKSFAPKSGYFMSFTGNPLKNLSQTASVAPEYQGILNTVYKVGGLGNVAGEAAVAFSQYGDMDFRSFAPYYAPDNASGGIKVKTPLLDSEGKQVMWQKPKMAGPTPVMENGKQVFEEVPAYKFISVPTDYVLKEGENFVIHEPVQEGKEWMTGYKVLDDTGIKGTVETINEDLTGMIKTPYKLFQVQGTGPKQAGNPTVYIVHTPKLAVFPKAYGGGAYAGKYFDDAMYSISSKATVDAIPKLNTEQFGYFNPGNFWFHDRQAFPAIMDIADASARGDEYWRGIRGHSSYHNPGRDYQGHYKSPIDFMQIVGTQQDLEEIKKNPDDYKFVRDMVKKVQEARQNPADTRFSPEEIMSKEEMEKLHAIFKPLYGEFRDEAGEYNMCKIPVESIRKNPYNFTAGTVSTTYGREMKNHNTKEIAQGLTKDFAAIPTVDIVNGSSAQNLHLDIIGNFGANNGFTDEVKAGFTPLTKEITESPDLMYAAKQKNKQWLINTIASKSKGGQDELAKLFFSDSAIKNGASVLGHLDEYKPGDVFFIGWGRPDTQKGFPTSLEGYLQFLKNPSVDAETKSHAKMMLGAGPWPEKAADWKTIQKQMAEIQALEGGKYAGNVCYLNGFFTNRIVACADYSNITSRYEPCGITPLESYAGGTPVISNNTGGSPDFVNPFKKGKEVTNETGFLTKNAYLVNPEVINADPDLKGVELDGARRLAIGKENAECIEQAMELSTKHPDQYKKMMMNAFAAKTDWQENGAFNGGRSALQRYKEEAWAIGQDNTELVGKTRNNDPLESLKGTIAQKEYSQAAQETTTQTVKEKAQEAQETVKKNKGKIAEFLSQGKNKYIAIGVALVAVAGIIYGLVTRNKKAAQKASEVAAAAVNQASTSAAKVNIPAPAAMSSSTPAQNPVKAASAARFSSIENFATQAKQ